MGTPTTITQMLDAMEAYVADARPIEKDTKLSFNEKLAKLNTLSEAYGLA